MKRYRLAYSIVSTALLALALLAPAWSEGKKAKPRVYITESQSWKLEGGGARPHTAEIINTFHKGCGESIVTMRKGNADYVVILEQKDGIVNLTHAPLPTQAQDRYNNLASNVPRKQPTDSAIHQPTPEKFIPETSKQDALAQAISERPQRRRPDKATLIAAAMAGVGGDPNVTRRILDRKYKQRLAVWREKIAHLKLLADQEREGNRLRQQQYYADRSSHLNRYKQARQFDKNHLFVVFRQDGDAIKIGSTKSLGNALTNACSALVSDWRNREHNK